MSVAADVERSPWQAFATPVDEGFHQTGAVPFDPAAENSPFPGLCHETDADKLRNVMREAGFRNAQMRLNFADSAARLARPDQMFENLQAMRVTEFSQATRRNVERQSLVHPQPHPCNEVRVIPARV